MSVRRGRAIYLAVHKYVGLVLGAWIALVGLTGSLLVYQRELEALQHPAFYRVIPAGPRVDLERIETAVQAAYPDDRIAGIERDLVAENESWKAFLQPAAEASGQTVIVRERKLTAFVDPYRAVVLGTLQGRTWLDATRDFHVELLMGPLGRIIAGSFAVALFLSIVAGIVLWWPSRKRFWKAFTLRWSSHTRLPRKMWDLHHVAGIYALVALIVVTGTGVVLVFQSDIQTLAGHIVDISPTKVDPTALPNVGPTGLNGAVDIVHQLYPDAIIRRVAPPTPTRPLYLFQIVPAGRSNMFTTNVQVRAETGQVGYIFDPARQAPARSFIGLWSVFIHNGGALGTPGRWIILASGLVYTLLLGTGVYIWAKKI